MKQQQMEHPNHSILGMILTGIFFVLSKIFIQVLPLLANMASFVAIIVGLSTFIINLPKMVEQIEKYYAKIKALINKKPKT